MVLPSGSPYYFWEDKPNPQKKTEWKTIAQAKMFWPRSARRVAPEPGSGMSICAQPGKASSMLGKPGSYTLQGVIVMETGVLPQALLESGSSPFSGPGMEGKALVVSRVPCSSKTAGWEKLTATRAGEGATGSAQGRRG